MAPMPSTSFAGQARSQPSIHARAADPVSTGESYVGGYDDAVATEPLHALLEQAFPDATELRVVDRTGGGDHFQVIVSSPRFNGLRLLDQHRLVNEALSEPLRNGTIHELRIKTRGTG
jgi:stress-induced morphogen